MNATATLFDAGPMIARPGREAARPTVEIAYVHADLLPTVMATAFAHAGADVVVASCKADATEAVVTRLAADTGSDTTGATLRTVSDTIRNVPAGTATVTSKGQITIPADVRAQLDIRPGSRIAFVRTSAGVYEIHPQAGSVRDLKGAVSAPSTPVTIDEMNEAISAGAAATD